MRRIIIWMIGCMLITGCAHTAADLKYVTATALPTDESWRDVFKEGEVVRLIETALAQNADIRIANLNVDQADAALRNTRMTWAPSLSIGAEGSMSKANGIETHYSYQVPVSMQWEINLYGQIHQQKSDEAAFWSAAERMRAVQMQTIAAVASQFYAWSALHAQIELTRQHLAIAMQTIDVMTALKDAGMASEASLSQARSDMLAIVATETTLRQQMQTTQNSLQLLLNTQEPLEMTPSPVDELGIRDDASVPLETLSRRPDVRAAEYDLQAATENIEIARAAFYPSINISASLGWTNQVDVPGGHVLFNLIGSVLQPLFNRGQNIANLRISKAQREQAFVTFQQTLLAASLEVYDALAACSIIRERMDIHLQQREEAQNAYQISIERMSAGDANYLEVITAQNAVIQSSFALSEDRLDLVQAQINLYKAKGGM